MSEDLVDVAIVGAGPGGLSMALALRAAVEGITVKIFERAGAFKSQGAGLRLEPNGVKALRALDPALLALVQQTGCYPQRMLLANVEGTSVVERSLTAQVEAEIKAYGVGNVYIGWSDLQKVLFEQLPPETVTLGCAFSHFDAKEDHVEVHFQDSDEVVKCRVLIGCDGLFSKVRKQWLNDGPPVDTGFSAWRGRVPVELTPEIGKDTTFMAIGQSRAIVAYPGSKGYVVWNASAPREIIEECGVDRDGLKSQISIAFSSQAAADTDAAAGEVIKERALKVFGAMPKTITDLIRITEPTAILEHGTFYRPLESYPLEGPLGEGRITLSGDAAHVIRPTGQGTNQALEDAVELAASFATLGLGPEALRAYEAKRLPRWRLISEDSQDQATAAYALNSASGKPVRKMDPQAVLAELHLFEVPELAKLRTPVALARAAGAAGATQGGRSVVAQAGGALARRKLPPLHFAPSCPMRSGFASGRSVGASRGVTPRWALA